MHTFWTKANEKFDSLKLIARVSVQIQDPKILMSLLQLIKGVFESQVKRAASLECESYIGRSNKDKLVDYR